MADGEGGYTVEEFTAGDGYRWKYRRYPAQGGAQAEVVFIHGIQSHAGWYTHSSAQLSRAGYSVSFLDRRGSGMNEQDRGDAPGFRRLLDDVAEFLTALPRTVPRGHSVGRLPVFLAGVRVATVEEVARDAVERVARHRRLAAARRAVGAPVPAIDLRRRVRLAGAREVVLPELVDGRHGRALVVGTALRPLDGHGRRRLRRRHRRARACREADHEQDGGNDRSH